MVKSIILIILIGLAIGFSGCTGSKDVIPESKTMPEVGNSDSVKQPTPTIVQTLKRNPYDNQAPQAAIRSDCSNGLLKLQHQGGADLILSDVKIIIDQGKSNLTYEGSSINDKFIAGDTLIFTPPSNISLNGRTLNTGKITGEIYTHAGFITTMLYIPNGQQIAQMRCAVFP